jgi:hypothetical protein
MKDGGNYIKIYRKMLDWEWYSDPFTKSLFLHLLVKANWKKGVWKGITVERGQLITGRQTLAVETGIKESTIERHLKRLQKSGEIEQETNNKFRLITICKYDEYQARENEVEQQTDNKRTTNGQQTDTIEEGKEGKKEKKTTNSGVKERFSPPNIQEVYDYCKERNNEVDHEKWFDYYTSKGWMIGKNKMKDWKAAVRTWERNSKSDTLSQGKTKPMSARERDALELIGGGYGTTARDSSENC